MSEYAALERELVTAIADAPDEAALEAVRISALGKKGRISELLKG
ncbi:MAG: phenylalanine--tRNA ligase subunit alpha, partial [Hyphomicrobiales bacterium]|nr:phenylalanine--tRNA ligase subunit alpha [Hyphomicrobiales bacterium]MBV9591642.1 phenylalanine--tRNA ligase subunit alpha [Hyphomicrobiales bacterium]